MTEQKPQWAAFIAAWVGWVLDAFDFTIYIVVAHHMIKEFGVSPIAIGGSLTATLIVRLLGGFFAGWMADRWGRKLPLMMSLVWFAAFDAAIYFAPSILYPHYASLGRTWGPDPLTDQQLAGIVMWGLGDVILLGALVVAIEAWLRADEKHSRKIRERAGNVDRASAEEH